MKMFGLGLGFFNYFKFFIFLGNGYSHPKQLAVNR